MNAVRRRVGSVWLLRTGTLNSSARLMRSLRILAVGPFFLLEPRDGESLRRGVGVRDRRDRVSELELEWEEEEDEELGDSGSLGAPEA